MPKEPFRNAKRALQECQKSPISPAKGPFVTPKRDLLTILSCCAQRCEGVRPDVQHLDQSMMTYEWFKKKQVL